MTKSFHVYGLFQGQFCLYVGQTWNPEARERNHRYTTIKGIDGVKMRILATFTSRAGALEMEKLMIAAFKSVGQAELNRKKKPMIIEPVVPWRPVTIQITFETQRELDVFGLVLYSRPFDNAMKELGWKMGMDIVDSIQECGAVITEGMEQFNATMARHFARAVADHTEKSSPKAKPDPRDDEE